MADNQISQLSGLQVNALEPRTLDPITLVIRLHTHKADACNEISRTEECHFWHLYEDGTMSIFRVVDGRLRRVLYLTGVVSVEEV